ncbi:MAG: recombination protein O N-terminal domain-containing protein [Candidatus Niyogibacteria bacterium]|nr:recombination protein O N-terminal domain-containing protein [Candidatus Niyogibacteria bacterium]
MHSVHHAEGIILAASDTGEADRMYTIYTKDHGNSLRGRSGMRHCGMSSIPRFGFWARWTHCRRISNINSRRDFFIGWGIWITKTPMRRPSRRRFPRASFNRRAVVK